MVPPDPGINGQVAALARVPGSGPPPVYLHDTGLDRVQAREEPADLGVSARGYRGGGPLVVPLQVTRVQFEMP